MKNPWKRTEIQVFFQINLTLFLRFCGPGTVNLSTKASSEG